MDGRMDGMEDGQTVVKGRYCLIVELETNQSSLLIRYLIQRLTSTSCDDAQENIVHGLFIE